MGVIEYAVVWLRRVGSYLNGVWLNSYPVRIWLEYWRIMLYGIIGWHIQPIVNHIISIYHCFTQSLTQQLVVKINFNAKLFIAQSIARQRNSIRPFQPRDLKMTPPSYLEAREMVGYPTPKHKHHLLKIIMISCACLRRYQEIRK